MGGVVGDIPHERKWVALVGLLPWIPQTGVRRLGAKRIRLGTPHTAAAKGPMSRSCYPGPFPPICEGPSLTSGYCALPTQDGFRRKSLPLPRHPENCRPGYRTVWAARLPRAKAGFRDRVPVYQGACGPQNAFPG